MVSAQSILGVLVAFAWGLLLYFTLGRYGEPTIYFALLLGIVGSLSFLGWNRLDKMKVNIRTFEIGVWLLVVIQLGILCFSPSLIYVRDTSANENLKLFLYLAAGFWLLSGTKILAPNLFPRWLQKPFFPIVAILSVMVAKALVISASPTPAIDVHLVLTQATDNFLDFKNPYTGTYPDIYGGAYGYAPTFSYWPGSLFLFAPYRFLGLDIRYGLWFFDALAGILLGLLAFRKFAILPDSVASGPPRSSLSRMSLAFSFASLWLTLPVSFFVLEQSWLDTVIVTGAVALLYCLLRDRFKTAAIIAGLMVTVKQYACFYIFFALIEFFRRARIRGFSLSKIMKWCGLGLLVFGVVMVPFIMLDPKAFYTATIGLYGTIPMRLDALTLRAWAGLRTHADTLEFFSNPVLLMIAMAGLSGWSFIQLRNKNSPKGLTYGVSSFIIFACIFLFGTHSFCNQYYFLVIWPLLIALV
jgi:hypothetical protein